jgi:hypothetical protein
MGRKDKFPAGPGLYRDVMYERNHSDQSFEVIFPHYSDACAAVSLAQ